MAYEAARSTSPDNRTDVPVRETQVNREVLGMGEHAEQIHNMLTALEDRLTPVLCPAGPPQPGTVAKDPSEPSVPLARAAWELNKRFESIRARIHGIMERLEV